MCVHAHMCMCGRPCIIACVRVCAVVRWSSEEVWMTNPKGVRESLLNLWSINIYIYRVRFNSTCTVQRTAPGFRLQEAGPQSAISIGYCHVKCISLKSFQLSWLLSKIVQLHKPGLSRPHVGTVPHKKICAWMMPAKKCWHFFANQPSKARLVWLWCYLCPVQLYQTVDTQNTRMNIFYGFVRIFKEVS